MPEFREYYAAYCMILQFLQELGPQEVDFIWGDDNTPDCPNSRKRDPSPPPECFVQLLSSGTEIIRGNGHYRGNIWPSQDISGPELKGSGMILRDIEMNPRNVILDMSIYWIQVQLSQHSFPQIWNKRIWNEISRVCQWKRGFKIGIVFEFSEYVLCFATADFLFSIQYSTTRQALKSQHINPLVDLNGWLCKLVKWLQAEDKCRRLVPSNLMEIVTEAREVWGGVGVYTFSEICFRAGLSPFLTYEEVFCNPSRTARLVAAYITWVLDTPKVIREILEDVWYEEGFTMAVTDKQRLAYMPHLRVFGHDEVWVYMRTKEIKLLHDAMIALKEKQAVEWYRGDDIPDIFEPSEIREALQKCPSLGPLIFTQEGWNVFDERDLPQEPELKGMIKLRKHLAKKVNLHNFVNDASARTHLDLSKYGTKLYLPKGDRLKMRCRGLLYNAGVPSKQVWTIHKYFGCLSRYKMRFDQNAGRIMSVRVWDKEERNKDPNPYIIWGTDRNNRLITHILKWSAEWTVGPLDFCGIGQVIRQGKITEVAYCREDPRLTLTLQYRNKASRTRRSNVKPGQRHRKIDDPKTLVLKLKLKEEQKKHRLQVACKGKQARKRLSADMHLAAAGDSLY
ncbi:hypothetical protein M422DRAFT_256475 [Sphaerobolus stellatus SS14]|uniref:Uncharacterized protein n=1 Tax=Sphaerobolus stellatus (strain SS14) TaxID=990650 RepID=A0A0C9UBJ7_SPHS4|nr:hypothetical protein M422DRAFT_256475 [Sphaerobolus stellatus SS14]